MAGRRGAIVARLTGGGTNTLAALQAAATAFDADTTVVSITHPTQFEVGTDGGGAGQPVGADEWAHTVTINIETGNPSLDEAGLECVLNGIKRAHGHYLYSYTVASHGVLLEDGDTLTTEAGDALVWE